MTSPDTAIPSAPAVGRLLLRLVLGIVASAAVMAVVFYFFLFPNPLGIHEANQLRWIPVLAAFGGLYASGWINRRAPVGYLISLFVPFVVFDLFGFLYFPFVLVLVATGVLALVVTRTQIPSLYRTSALSGAAAIFAFHLLAQPLILEHDGFGRDANGELQNATVVWDFSGAPALGLPSHVLIDAQGESFDVASLNGSTQFVSYWATWCTPCIRDLPMLDSLKAELDGTVGFVDISVDDDQEAWRSFLVRRPMDGVQLLAPSPDETRRVLSVSALPSHVVLRADGTQTTFHTLEEAEAMLRSVAKPNEY